MGMGGDSKLLLYAPRNASSRTFTMQGLQRVTFVDGLQAGRTCHFVVEDCVKELCVVSCLQAKVEGIGGGCQTDGDVVSVQVSQQPLSSWAKHRHFGLCTTLL